MAVLMRHEAPGMTRQEFEQMTAPVFDQLKTYPGFISHASGTTSGGYQVTEVWESREAHERWLREVIMPLVQRAGISDLPPATYQPIERFFIR